MKRVRYTRYSGDLASEIEMDDLLKALSDYLLDSGFQDPYSRFSELNGEHTLENLREAIRQALESGELFDDDAQQRLQNMSAEQIVHSRCGAGVGRMDELDSGRKSEKLHRHVRHAAMAG